jgi:ProP effector
MNNKTRRRRELAAETLPILAERFPLSFSLQESHRRPLKIGIDRDLASAVTDISTRAIKDALRFYVGSSKYQRALVHGAERIDLAGAPAGIVSAEAAAQAKASIELASRRRKQASVATREEQDASNERQTIPKAALAAPTAEVALAADNRSAVGAPAPPASARHKLTLAGLREAAQQRKTVRESQEPQFGVGPDRGNR